MSASARSKGSDQGRTGNRSHRSEHVGIVDVGEVGSKLLGSSGGDSRRLKVWGDSCTVGSGEKARRVLTVWSAAFLQVENLCLKLVKLLQQNTNKYKCNICTFSLYYANKLMNLY